MWGVAAQVDLWTVSVVQVHLTSPENNHVDALLIADKHASSAAA